MVDLMDLTQLDVDENERPVKYVLPSHLHFTSDGTNG
jgi:hypothetical protein